MTVKAAGLGMHAGEQWLFRGLDLDVAAGECLVLVGDNGSGKSTVLHLLYGLRAPSEGTIEVAGEEPDERAVSFRRKVAVLLDDSELFVELSPRQHLELLLTSFDADGAVADWLAAAGLSERADVHAYYLSAGQRRRLLLLGAVARPHEVLLLDEPERALDGQGKEWLAELVEQERAAGRTVVLATHHPALLEVADHVVRLG
ncbi:ABC transporter ATP-binding protein [Actinophytocola algeriensis]|uniref:ABC-type multidrug transport system ATPase subunit n=1 Tax=Actinophytocola algeriensis TaxID=1768010 RepID=A0A7W7PZU6_9PSEU|nr:ABC transporter ATP-binding protein [Actinophytocola algeriensis]MBB4904238.1 ABC-type multidrug transport system ATPase subunit [Actinophytocola algeriensis]MBE1476904.1 ABC-type multidrug transport system ATPase subunit [Actinophytocola algeriensis]